MEAPERDAEIDPIGPQSDRGLTAVGPWADRGRTASDRGEWSDRCSIRSALEHQIGPQSDSV